MRLVINMDETGSTFDIPCSTTVNQKGAQHVNVKSTNNSGSLTVFLACALDGSKLTPMVVFKGQPGKTVEKGFTTAGNTYDRRVVCCVQENNYCDERVMLLWIEKVLRPYLATMDPGICLFMMDNFAPHQKKSVRCALATLNCLQVMLPPNMTSRVQMLDVGVNKPFKDRMKHCYREHMLDEIEDNATKVKITRELMTEWIADSYEGVPSSAIKNTARKIGFIDEE